MWYIKQRLSAFDEHPSLLPRISEIEVEMKRIPYSDHIRRELQPRTTLIVSAILQKASHMPRLHTARFSGVTMKQEHLALLFQSNNLQTLILYQCYLPRLVRLPPSSIRHLTLSLIQSEWQCIESFLGHCSANLEALDFVGHLSQEPGSTRLPLFPKLRKLKFTENSGSISHLDTLTSLAPQLEHLELEERNRFHGLSALPASLNRLSISQWTIETGDFGTRPFVQLLHLHLTFYNHDSRRGFVIPIIHNTFPNLTRLHVDIDDHSCNFVLLLARTLPNVTWLKLGISGAPLSLNYDYDTSLYTAETHGGPLASLHVNMVLNGEKHGMELYKKWVIHTVLGPTVGLGGPHLQEVEVEFLTPDTSAVPVALWCWKQVEKEWVFNQY